MESSDDERSPIGAFSLKNELEKKFKTSHSWAFLANDAHDSKIHGVGNRHRALLRPEVKLGYDHEENFGIKPQLFRMKRRHSDNFQ